MGSCSSKNSSATAVIDINDISNDNLKLIASFLDVPTCLMLAVAFTASPSSPGWKDQNNMILSTASKSILYIDVYKYRRTYHKRLCVVPLAIINIMTRHQIKINTDLVVR